MLHIGNRRGGALSAVNAEAIRIRGTRELEGEPRPYLRPALGRLHLAGLVLKSLILLRPDMGEIWRMALDTAPEVTKLLTA